MNPTPAKRSLRLLKSVCWVLLFAGAGTLIFLIMMMLAGDTNQLRREFMLPLSAFVTVVVSGATLFRSYKVEPADFSGFWHLSIVDCYVVIAFTALLMAAFRGIWPQDFAPVGIFTTLILGLGFAFCVLLAARRGCVKLGLKTVCALGTFFTALGLMVTGFFFFLIAFTTVSGYNRGLERCLEPVAILFYLHEPIGKENWAFNVIRIGMLLIPLGFLLRRYVAHQLSRAKPAPSGITK